MIRIHLLSVQIQRMTFMRTLMTTTKSEKKILIVFDDMIQHII